MKIKTSKLTGATLDWAVAKCEGLAGTGKIYFHGPTPKMEQDLSKYSYQDAPESAYDVEIPPFSTDWAQGGPIIEREKISLDMKHNGWWVASFQYNYSDDKEYIQLANTPLIAAMRCYCASKLGDDVEIPEELA